MGTIKIETVGVNPVKMSLEPLLAHPQHQASSWAVAPHRSPQRSEANKNHLKSLVKGTYWSTKAWSLAHFAMLPTGQPRC